MNNPAFNYDRYGHKYSGHRRTDPRIAAYVNAALGPAKTVLNVGAGAGSYEPSDRYVIAVEPSSVMRAQRLDAERAPAIIGTADSLPFDDNSFDAAMAMVTVHHWPDIQEGLQELRRVTRGQVIVMTFDPDALHEFWNADYFPELIEVERRRYPTMDDLYKAIGGKCEVHRIPIPLDCVDGFQEAFYGRPEAFLEKEVRMAQSAWGFLPEGVEEKLVRNFADELESGEWDRKYGKYRTTPFFTGALRLIIGWP
ncbi:class I SAM-dependent methyltransferase [Alicyclobacillus fastidiosus]|uniref:Class I SAM-dependent methyltransferase n=1 Tax=Alicyclobacillus fastidiosus TaxID=392011 RepID=A0ABV5AJ86_9BACL|nr:class I SAM-dependent methyltransferase [Alicyclobacillus fastidiosus]WEH12146.1 class I SAM-dependent methyltransferase [Alicyclobacillus fastidiosus]